MKLRLTGLLLLCGTFIYSQNTTRIAFGSCIKQTKTLQIFDTIASHEPETFIFLGDNIYGDTRNMDTLREKYIRLASTPGYRRLTEDTYFLATWDDHDYGENDGGKNYPMKKESKEMFLNFFNEPDTSARRKRDGIYTSYHKYYNGKVLQIIMLDCRSFRDDLRKANRPNRKRRGISYTLKYMPHKKKDVTLLGQEQWSCLEKELKKPADLRLICSSTQFAAEFNGREAWANFPHEQKRFLELIKTTKANGVVFLSGDAHFAEISKLDKKGLYPIYDITSSALSAEREFATVNKNRIAGAVRENNFGLLTIDWTEKPVRLTMEIWDVDGKRRIESTISLNEIRFKE